MARRDAITRRRKPTQLVALIGEPAVRGGIGGRDVMVDQLRYLLDVADRDNVTLQIVGVDGEWHPGHIGPFIIYEFHGARRPIVYFEHHRSGGLLVDESDIQDYRVAVEIMHRVGMTPAESLEFITELIKSVEETP